MKRVEREYTEIGERARAGLWGAIVGDALGVPVEFRPRTERAKDPVVGMRSGGTWKQPAGTWSDDSSLMLCTVDSLIDGFDTNDMGRRFVEWRRGERWTAHGTAFDIGGTTQDALSRIINGTVAEEAGGKSEHCNGNGSLMRILPVALAFHRDPVEQMLDKVRRVSRITHAHEVSLMACCFYCLVARELLSGASPAEAYALAIEVFVEHHRRDEWEDHLEHFERILGGKIADCPEEEIESGGYVLETLEASLWCLLNSGSFPETVLKAVNLGRDTDTTGCVLGGLGGLRYGMEEIPSDWVKVLARRGDVDLLFDQFLETIFADGSEQLTG